MWLMLWAIIVDNNISGFRNSGSRRSKKAAGTRTSGTYFVLCVALVSGFWL